MSVLQLVGTMVGMMVAGTLLALAFRYGIQKPWRKAHCDHEPAGLRIPHNDGSVWCIGCLCRIKPPEGK